ncbi:hypothetical protein CANARDRAFT_29463 [[Candida] arabinofermentans NRRL YB-2248]|uniref:Autophagy-related protein 27 n=1 Tax=[Candida] arabinofermentans NRRL YB-2248 TaxID=983967 RepID=A0A1E4SWY5_9ASCO|nr:hypothetical protein CANARDRAFT_29463 [[Candida] arabinofermentans NRRL YB-2248]
MNLLLFTLTCTFLASLSIAIDLSDERLKNYPNIINLKGLHTIESNFKTPPSEKSISWYLNLYDSKDKSSKNEIKVTGCPLNSQICGLTEVKLPSSSKPILTELISFPSDLTFTFGEELNSSLVLKIPQITWGEKSLSAEIELICKTEGDDDSNYNFQFDESIDNLLKFKLESKNACKSSSSTPDDDKLKNPPNDQYDDSKGWGFFTWLFILFVLILASYIIGQAWINSNRIGGSHGFLEELIESILETFSKLPDFTREILGKFTGNGNRAGYSAV